MSKTSKLLTQVGSVAALCFMFIAFQNCGKQMEFSSSSLEKATLVEVPLDNDNDVPDIPEDDTPEENPPVVDNPPQEDTPGSTGDTGTNGDSGDNGDVVDVNGEPEGEEGPKLFICILEGSGKSQKLALVEDILVAQTSAAKTVCTTERACLEIASQSFSVISAEKRGFCKQANDHSVHLSESQLQAVIDNSN